MGLKAVANTGGGSGAVSSVSNADGTLTISPTTGTVVASINLANANTWTAAQTISVASVNAFTVGQNGQTNPAFNIDTSAASSVTGLNIKSNSSGNGVALTITSTATNDGIGISAKGTSSVLLQNTNSINSVFIGSASNSSATSKSLEGPNSSGLTDQAGAILNINAPRGSGLGTLGTLALRASVTNQGVSGTTAHAETTIVTIGNPQTSYPALNGSLINFNGTAWVDIFSPANTTNTSLALYNFGVGTVSALNTGIVVNSATCVHIGGAPSQGTNTSITATSALRIDNGTATSAQTISYGIIVANTSLASGSSTTGNSGNIGISAGASGAATGQNVGVYGSGANSTLRNYGGAFQATTAVAAPNVGIVCSALNGSTSTAGYFALLASGLSPLNTVIQAENGASGSPFFLATTAGVSVFDLNSTGLIRIYNGVTTAGWGIPAIYGAGRTVGATAAVASVATYTVGAADGSFDVVANVLVTTSTLHSFTVTVAYTDEGNTSRVLTLQFSNLAGTFLTTIANAAGAVPYEGVAVSIRAKAGTAITIASAAGGTYTTVAYNIEGFITQKS